MKHFALPCLALCLAVIPASLATPAAAQDAPSAKDFYKQCKNAKSDNPDQMKVCYIDSFIELRKSGDAAGKCAPGLIGLISQPHTHFMRLRATMKDNKPSEDEALLDYQKRVLSATYPCN